MYIFVHVGEIRLTDIKDCTENKYAQALCSNKGTSLLY